MLTTIARIARRATIPVLAAIAVFGLAVPAGAAVIDPLPISPNQFFSGSVNGNQTNATIVADCVGVARTGHPAGGQYVEAQPAPGSGAATIGFTGSLGRSLTVSLVLAPATAPIPIGTLSGYFIKLPIPTSITIPCGGTGQMVFAPSPTSPTARSATVSITIISLGA
jgi:hypothetical protein